MLRKLPFEPDLYFAEVPVPFRPVMDPGIGHAKGFRVVVPVEAEERFDRAAGSVVREEVIDRGAHAGPDVPGSGAGYRVVLGVG